MSKSIKPSKHVEVFGPYTKGKTIWYVYGKDGREHRAETKEKLSQLVYELTIEGVI